MLALIEETFLGLGIVVAALGAWFIHRIAERERAADREERYGVRGLEGITQLVGRSCVVCGERIRTVRDGDFCPDCDAPVHYRCEEEHGCFRESIESEEAELEPVEIVRGERASTWVGIPNPNLAWGLWYLLLGLPLIALGVAGFVYGCIRGMGPFAVRGLLFAAGLVTLGVTLTMRGVRHFRWMRDE